MRILLTGGSGLLGTELRKLIKVDAPTHSEFDILNPERRKKYDLIIHTAAYVHVPEAEKNKDECFIINVYGTHRLLLKYLNIPFVFISSEYAHKPVNHYSVSKYLGEEIVKNYSKKYLIIRTAFKRNPFRWNKAFRDQYTQGDYVNIIAKLIVKVIKKWNRKPKLIYVGTGRKTMLQLARRTKPNIKSCSIKDIKRVVLPKDYK